MWFPHPVECREKILTLYWKSKSLGFLRKTHKNARLTCIWRMTIHSGIARQHRDPGGEHRKACRPTFKAAYSDKIDKRLRKMNLTSLSGYISGDIVFYFCWSCENKISAPTCVKAEELCAPKCELWIGEMWTLKAPKIFSRALTFSHFGEWAYPPSCFLRICAT